MSDDDIKSWLERHELGEYADVFLQNDIRVADLSLLTEDHLRELGLQLVKTPIHSPVGLLSHHVVAAQPAR